MNIETRPVFYPANKMPPYFSNESFPVADNISSRGLSLPSFPELSPKQIKYICESISNFFEKNHVNTN